ncbi:chorismate mutase [Bacillus cereus]|uniref:chorismate mutase n=1 Tax=Bacillus cereus TaxID=1396 RepID=UPI002AC2D074|nr:chorismate mutase [Bacillus cereus]MDZ4417400.1 chorismate mutase [Bacillus cereus]
MNELCILRGKILELDTELLNLLSRRGEIVKKIGKEKMKLDIKINDPKRENELLHQLTALNCGPYGNTMIEKIYKELFQISKELQETLNDN